MNDFVIRNDLSELGLRRLHVLRPGEPVDAAHYVKVAEEEGGELRGVIMWCDEALDNHHLYLAWRLTMFEYPMYCWTLTSNSPDDLGAAARRAAEKFQKKFGIWPNRAVVKDFPGAKPKGVLITSEKGEELATLELEFVERNFQAGIVGVFFRQEAANG